ncbi:hypothetical protein PoB_001429700, partial [Plakobranchus ocellatus]
RPLRLQRELRGLGILNPRGNIRNHLRRPEVIPQNSLEATFHPDERFCSAFLQKPEGLRQCKNKPLRNSDRCRHHSKLEFHSDLVFTTQDLNISWPAVS